MTAVISWPLTLLTARFVSPESFSYIAAIGVMTRFSLLVAEGGIRESIVLGRHLTEEQQSRLHGLSLLLFCSAAIAVCAAAPIADSLLGLIDSTTYVLALGVLVAIEGTTVVPSARLLRELRYKELALRDAARVIVQGVATVVLAVLGYEAWALVGGLGAGIVAYSVAVHVAYPMLPSIPRRAGLEDVLASARRLLASSVVSFFSGNLVYASGARVTSLASFGGFSYMSQIVEGPVSRFAGAAQQAFTGYVGANRESKSATTHALVLYTRFIFLGVLPALVGLAVLSESIVEVVLGAPWRPYVSAMAIICFAVFVATLIRPLRTVLVATSGARPALVGSIVEIAVIAMGLLIVKPSHGAAGLATIVAMGNVAVLIYLSSFLRKHDLAPTRALVSAMVPGLTSAGGMAIATWLVAHRLAVAPNMDALIAGIGTGIVVYIAALRIFFKHDMEFMVGLLPGPASRPIRLAFRLRAVAVPTTPSS